MEILGTVDDPLAVEAPNAVQSGAKASENGRPRSYIMNMFVFRHV